MSGDDLVVARLGVMSALRDGDAALAYRLVMRLMDEGYSMSMVIEEVLAPLQSETGRRWEVGDTTISEEHVSTAAVETLVSMLGGLFDQPDDARVVVVVCAEGDTHSLPARMASALLAYEGYRTLYLGTSVPAGDLGEFLQSAEADVLVISCTRPVHLLGARACVDAAHDAGVPVVVGGRAFATGDRWKQIGADAYAPKLSELGELLESWQPDPVQVDATDGEVPPAAKLLVAERASIAAATTAAMTRSLAEPGSSAGEVGRFISEAVSELVQTLAVAVALDDESLVADEGRWLAGLLSHRTDAEVNADALFGHLADAVGSVAPDAVALVEAARLVASSVEQSTPSSDLDGAGT